MTYEVFHADVSLNVRVFDASATLLDEFFAFDPGFLGGIFVAG